MPNRLHDLRTLHRDFKLLLQTHHRILQLKECDDRLKLLNLIKLDYERVMLALLEVKNSRVLPIVNQFFGHHQTVITYIEPHIKPDEIFHIGFEIYEPMDMVMQGFEYWINKFNRIFNTQFQVNHYLRFPASTAFQERVQAFVEIVRVWIQLGERELMLELFDIHHPIEQFLPQTIGKLTTVELEKLFTGRISLPNHDQIIQRYFGMDMIWHYAIVVSTVAEVNQLHLTLQQFAKEHQEYQLPYAHCVQNQHDGSYHTKVINQEKRLELEFVAHEKVPPVNKAGI